MVAEANCFNIILADRHLFAPEVRLTDLLINGEIQMVIKQTIEHRDIKDFCFAILADKSNLLLDKNLFYEGVLPVGGMILR